ncbi:MAG: alpha/beta hydrolase family protein [Planctomycetota bacterium]|jgi:dipeptidyl aminopeptidase/acylaminoacyl peptidase
MDAAKECVRLMKIKEWKMLVDDFSCSMQRDYGGLPNMVYIIDRAGNVAWKAAWTRANEIQSKLEELCGRSYEKISYMCKDLSLKALLFKPEAADNDKFPAVIYCHAGTDGMQGGDISFCEKLMEEGYVVAAPEFRGQGGSEGKVEFAGGEVEDVKSLLKHMKELGCVNMDKVVIVGEKLGATIALLACADGLDVRACAVVTPVTDFQKLFEKNKDLAEEAARTSGIKSDNADEWEKRSPASCMEKFKIPLGVIHSKKNGTIDVSHSRALAKLAGQAGAKVKTKYLRGEESRLIENAPKDVFKFVFSFIKKYAKP